jgi:hypothetical protein
MQHDALHGGHASVPTTPLAMPEISYLHHRLLGDVKRATAERWVAAVNAEATYGHWEYVVAKKTTAVPELISAAAKGVESAEVAMPN